MKKRFLNGYKTYDPVNGFGNADEWRSAFTHRMGQEEAEQVLAGCEQTPHQVLGVLPDATPTATKRAFRSLIKEWHPDHNPHRLKEAEEQTKRILAAYTKLSTSDNR